MWQFILSTVTVHVVLCLGTGKKRVFPSHMMSHEKRSLLTFSEKLWTEIWMALYTNLVTLAVTRIVLVSSEPEINVNDMVKGVTLSSGHSNPGTNSAKRSK